ncbi:MAG: hypothetical protein ACJZ8E_09760 [Pseudohongiellaceae bacterium]
MGETKTQDTSLALISERNILIEEKDDRSVNPEQSAFIDCCVNSIEHRSGWSIPT